MEAYESLDAFLRELPALAAPHRDKLRGRDHLFRLEWGGRAAYIRLADGVVTVLADCAEQPACTLRADEQVALALIGGRLNPMRALLTGKVRVQGDAKPLMQLCKLL